MWLQSIIACNMSMQLKEGALSCNWRIEKGIRVVPFKRHNHHQLCWKILLLCKFFFSSTPEEVVLYPMTWTKMAGRMNFLNHLWKCIGEDFVIVLMSLRRSVTITTMVASVVTMNRNINVHNIVVKNSQEGFLLKCNSVFKTLWKHIIGQKSTKLIWETDSFTRQ